MSQLWSKFVPVVDECPVCKCPNESILHALVTCSFAAQCWQIGYPTVSLGNFRDFSEWLHHCFIVTNKNDRATVATLCWAIWKARNDLQWNEKHSQPNTVVVSAKLYLIQWRNAQASSSKTLFQHHVAGDGAESWVKPQTGTIKVTTDAALFSDRNAYGFGMIARDSRGGLVEARTGIKQGSVSSDYAETMAIKEALSWIKEMKWPRVQLESDCLAIIQAIRSKVQMLSPLGLLIHDCRNLLSDLNTTSLSFINRSANMAAHTLARVSYSHPGRVFDRRRDVPIDTKNVLLSEFLI